jgi:putative transposase
MSDFGIAKEYLIPDQIWHRVQILFPPPKEKKKPGRPRMDDRKAFNAMLYVLRTGIQWKALPRSLGASSTVHDRFTEWTQAGVFLCLWQQGLILYDQKKGIHWERQAMDGAHNQAKKGGECIGPSYKHRGKSGTNRSILTDGNGIPFSAIVEKANRNDFKLTRSTLFSPVIQRPLPSEKAPQHLYLDKGYDYPEVDEIVAAFGYTAHISRRGQTPDKMEQIPKYRWVVERTHAWLNNFRRVLIRWEKKVDNYLSFLHFACAWICFRAAGAL